MDKEKLLSIIRMRGPVLPIDISKSLETDSIMAGAFLSELVSKKALKLSHLKVGGSPLYYIPGQEAQLERFKDSLKSPEKNAFDLLKEKKVLRDSILEPVVRVSLRNIKDFAKPIEVTINGQKELFWRWHTVRNDEIQNILSPKPEPVKEEPKPVEEIKQEEPKQEIKTVPDIPKEEPEPVQEKLKEDLIEEIKKVEGKPIKKPVKEKVEQPVKENQEPVKPSGEFSTEIINFFETNKIDILNQTIVRTDSEIAYEVLIPSVVGKLMYLVIAKSKKKCTDADLAQVYVKVEMKKLPAIFLYKGDLTKKAKEMLKKEFKNITPYRL